MWDISGNLFILVQVGDSSIIVERKKWEIDEVRLIYESYCIQI